MTPEEPMDVGAPPQSGNSAWHTAQAALTAQQSDEKVPSSSHNNNAYIQSFATSELPLPQQAAPQQWMAQPNSSTQYNNYGYPPPPPPSQASSYAGYQSFADNSLQHGYGAMRPQTRPPRASYSSHFTSSRAPSPNTGTGIRFQLNPNQNRFQSNQMRFGGPQLNTRPPLPPPTRPSRWEPAGVQAAPPPPSSDNSTIPPQTSDNFFASGVTSQDNQSTNTNVGSGSTTTKQSTNTKPSTSSAINATPNVPPPPSDGNNAADWPPTMKSWVTRCFAAAQSDVDKDLMERKLKEVISDSFARQRVQTTDWATYPIPMLSAPVAATSTPPVSSRLGPSPHQGRGGRGGKRGRGGRGGRGGGYNGGYNKDSRESHRGRSRSRSSSGSRRTRSRSRERYSRRRKSAREGSRSRSYSSDSSISNADFIPLHSKVSKTVWQSQKAGKSPKGQRGINKRLGGKAKRGAAAAAFRPTVKDRVNIQKRVARFGDQSAVRKEPLQLSINSYADADSDGAGWDEDTKIVGTCQDIEKEYLRLTNAPSASAVRPVRVLVHSLENVKVKWAKKGDYRWTCEQFKSIRQDLTVQCVRDEFTAKVYETHARVALEAADHCEFNQCQAQLKALYSEGVHGNKLEFTSYRILYYVFTTNTIDMISALSGLQKGEKDDTCVSFALAFRSAWSLNNYHRIFKLYKKAPKMTGYVIDMFLKRERITALKIMINGYRPTITLDFLQTELGYTADCSDDRDSLNKFLVEQGAKLTADSSRIDCKIGLNPPPAQS